MTELTKYTTPGSHNLQVPTRSEFHHYFSNDITYSDFYTDHSNGLQVEKVASALYRTLRCEKERNQNQKWRKYS